MAKSEIYARRLRPEHCSALGWGERVLPMRSYVELILDPAVVYALLRHWCRPQMTTPLRPSRTADMMVQRQCRHHEQWWWLLSRDSAVEAADDPRDPLRRHSARG